MKTQSIIRILAGLSFLIFICPFFQMCSDNQLKKGGFKRENIDVTTSQYEKELQLKKHQEEVTFNGYEMGYYIFKPDGGESEFKFKDLLDIQFYAFFSYIIIMILSILIFAFSFRSKYKVILFLSLANILLAVGSMAIFYFEGGLDDPAQIKFGYYIFLMNSIAIIAFCNRTIKRNAI